MSFCSNCGKELRDDEAFCSQCGNTVNAAPQQPFANQAQPQQAQQPYQPVQYTNPSQAQQTMYQPVEEEKNNIATSALIFALVMPIVGFILGIIGAVKYKSEKLKTQCIIAIPLSIVAWVIGIFILL